MENMKRRSPKKNPWGRKENLKLLTSIL